MKPLISKRTLEFANRYGFDLKICKDGDETSLYIKEIETSDVAKKFCVIYTYIDEHFEIKDINMLSVKYRLPLIIENELFLRITIKFISKEILMKSVVECDF